MSTALALPQTRKRRHATGKKFDRLYEIVDDRVVKKENVGAREIRFANQLALLLSEIRRVSSLGQVFVEMIFDLRPAISRHRRPDVAFVSFKSWPLDKPVPDGPSWPVIPDLAVEVISKTNPAYEVKEKTREYFAADVGRVWVVYPHFKEIEDYDAPNSVRIAGIKDTLDCSALWPGVKLKMARVFENP